jgi:hypothetical protein
MDKSQWRAAVGILVCGILCLLPLGCSGTGDYALAGMLPGDNEVESWVRVGPPTMATTDTQLYNQIDGAAPKYIDRGWQGTVYAAYEQGGVVMQVAIHNMGSSYNAESIFNYDLPVSRIVIGNTDPNDPLGARPKAVVDLGLPTAYQAKAFTGQYYIEVSIDDRSDAALASVEAFTVKILDRNTRATKL